MSEELLYSFVRGYIIFFTLMNIFFFSAVDDMCAKSSDMTLQERTTYIALKQFNDTRIDGQICMKIFKIFYSRTL